MRKTPKFINNHILAQSKIITKAALDDSPNNTYIDHSDFNSMSIRENIHILNRQMYSRILLPTGIPKLMDIWNAKCNEDAVFIWIPKNAGTSLHRALACPRLLKLREVKWRFRNRGLVTFGHMDYRLLVSMGYVNKEFDQKSFKFSFARNPYSRAVSLYQYLRGKRFPGNWTFNEFCKRIETEEITCIGSYNNKGMVQCNPQVRWLDHLQLDFLGHFETVEEDIVRIQDILGLKPSKVPRLNQSMGAKKDYRELYDERSVRAVSDFYGEDFEIFGYSKDLNQNGKESLLFRRDSLSNSKKNKGDTDAVRHIVE